MQLNKNHKESTPCSQSSNKQSSNSKACTDMPLRGKSGDQVSSPLFKEDPKFLMIVYRKISSCQHTIHGQASPGEGLWQAPHCVKQTPSKGISQQPAACPPRLTSGLLFSLSWPLPCSHSAAAGAPA